MITLSHKTKQYLLAALKVLLLAATFWYIYYKVTQANAQTLAAFLNAIQLKNGFSILVFVVLAGANQFFEVLKWKTLVSEIESISFKTALQQSLASLTISMSTPNRIGEYGAKALYFPKHQRKQVLLLNFFGNIAQLLATFFFGIVGTLYVVQRYGIEISTTKLVLLLVVLLGVGTLGYYFKEKQLLLKGLSIAKVMKYISNIEGVRKLKVMLYALLRYVTFSCLFYLLLTFFGAKLPIFDAFLLIFAMYLLVSILPSIFIFDVILRGGVAVWLFTLAGVPELSILCTVLAMWLLNFVLPSLFGSYYVVTYKPVAA